MKALNLMLFFLFHFAVQSQVLQDLKLRDTMYFFMDIDLEFDNLRIKSDETETHMSYRLIFPDGKSILLESLKIKPENSKILRRKKFFNCNKNKIITLEDIRKTGFRKTLKILFYSKITVYIIDTKDIRKRKILVRKASLMTVPDVVM